MKKALIVLLILAVAGGLFAQSFTGSVATGAKITLSDDIPVVATDDDSGNPVKAALDFSNSGDDWGVGISATANVDGDSNVNGVLIDAMNGWVKFADIFKLTAGKGQGGNWQATDFIDENIPSSNAGARLNVTPIDGLDLGVVFGYPNKGVKAGKIANFFQETGIGVKYDAGILVAGTSLKLFSEETEGYSGTDANWMFDVKIPLSILTVHVDGHINNLTEKGGKMDKLIGLKLNGTVVGLSWNVWAKAWLNDPMTAKAHAGLEYPIALNDKATATLGADADLTLLQDASFDSWDIWAKLAYAFSGNVSTYFKLKVDGKVDPSEVTPSLVWAIKYSF